MQILPVQNNVNNIPQFKSVYPVVHWVAETNSSYAPALTEELSRTLNGKFVRLLNTRAAEIFAKIKEVQKQIQSVTLKINCTQDNKLKYKLEKQLAKLTEEEKSLSFIQKIRQYLGQKDKDYAETHYVRTFYNKNGGLKGNKFEPMVYLLTGKDAVLVEDKLGRPIGNLQNKLGLNNSAEIQIARHNYWKQGLNYVKERSKKQADNDIPTGLHIKMNVVRTKTGNIKGYDIVGMGFYPLEGENSPFVKTGFIKSSNQ